MDAKNQFDERKKNWLVQKSGLRWLHRPYAAADPDLQIRKGAGGGGGHSDPEIRGGRSQKVFFGLWASLWSKNEGGGVGAPGPLPWIPHCYVTKAVSIKKKTNVGSARRVKWLIKPSFNYMFTCSLFSHPMLKCVEYNYFYIFCKVEMFRNFTILRDQEIILWRCLNAETIFIKLTLSFFSFSRSSSFWPKCKSRQILH